MSMKQEALKSLFIIKRKPLLIILAVLLAITLWNPFQLTPMQSVLFATFMFAVGSWATGALDRTLTSVLLLISFLIFGNTKPLSILGFVWSDVLLLIAFSSLLSVALGKNIWLRSVLSRFVLKTTRKKVVFYAMPYLLGIALIFLIPQAFARVVLLAGLYGALMRKDDALSEARYAVFFHIYMAVTVTYMMFIGGDIVLNYSLATFVSEAVDVTLDGFTWLKMMGVPTLVLSALMIVLVNVLLKKELPADPVSLFALEPEKEARSVTAAETKKDALGLVVMVLIVLFWATEGWHGIAGWMPALGGVILLFLLGRLHVSDLSAINPKFLIFLMAAFNIGQVLRNSGVMAAIMEQLKTLIPDGGSFLFLPALILITMLLHLFIGSVVATLSVVIPLLLPLAILAGVSPYETALIFYMTGNLHFLLPFHQANMMIGAGRGELQERHMLRYGIVMTVAIFLIIFGLYRPWWSLISP